MKDVARGTDGASIGAVMEPAEDFARWKVLWVCEKWSEEACLEAMKFVDDAPQDGVSCVGSELLRELGIVPDLGVEEVPGNLLLNEGIQLMWDLIIGALSTTFNNANTFIGVGDTNTAEAATQTELLATQNAANRFYKVMVATYPIRTNQTVDFRSDFTGTEANFAWAEWTVARGATTASGSGFLVGTTNMNRKVQALGTKASGTWTMTASITLA